MLLILRWVGLISLLVGEIVWLTGRFSFPGLTGELNVLEIAIASCGTLFLLASPHLQTIMQSLRHQAGYRWWAFGLLHGAAFLTFAAATARFSDAGLGSQALSALMLGGWVAAAGGTFIFWLMALAPPGFWLRFGKQQSLNILLGLLVGGVVWLGGVLAQTFWRPLAEATLSISHLLLSSVYTHVTYEPTEGLLGTDSFLVEIAPSCSGYEGIALVSVFVALYLWLFRKQVRFPNALLLLPIGVLAIWVVNVLRVSALVALGTSISPEIAVGGFHSQAGWIGFAVVSLGLIGVCHRWWLSAGPLGRFADLGSGSRLATVLLTPFLALMAVSMLTAAMSDEFNALYPIAVIIPGLILWRYREAYRTLFNSWSWQPVVIGALVFVFWVLLEPPRQSEGQALLARLAELPLWLSAVWVGFRALGSVVTVSFAEELAFRGYLSRKLIAIDFENVNSGQFTLFSFTVSSVLFGVLHQRLLAGTLAGACFALALYQRGSVGDAVIAHATSNALIAAAVLGWGYWGLWT